jgi:chromosome segregation ATPase
VRAPARNPEADREIARLRSQLQDRNGEIADLQNQIADLQRRLSETMNEAVRAMARLRTLATRAEAASAIAEAEVTVQQIRQRSPRADLQEADRLLHTAGVEFEAENYGGAVYLATQTKRSATSAERH